MTHKAIYPGSFDPVHFGHIESFRDIPSRGTGEPSIQETRSKDFFQIRWNRISGFDNKTFAFFMSEKPQLTLCDLHFQEDQGVSYL